jgi:hypothetical protein
MTVISAKQEMRRSSAILAADALCLSNLCCLHVHLLLVSSADAEANLFRKVQVQPPSWTQHLSDSTGW